MVFSNKKDILEEAIFSLIILEYNWKEYLVDSLILFDYDLFYLEDIESLIIKEEKTVELMHSNGDIALYEVDDEIKENLSYYTIDNISEIHSINIQDVILVD